MRCIWLRFGTHGGLLFVSTQGLAFLALRMRVSLAFKNVASVACVTFFCVNSIRTGLCYVGCVELETSLHAYQLGGQLAMLAYATIQTPTQRQRVYTLVTCSVVTLSPNLL